MKKFSIYLLCLCMMLGMLPASASTEQVSAAPQSKAAVQSRLSSQYIITVPDSVVIDKNGAGQISVVASNLDLPWSAQLSVQVSSNNYRNNTWYLKHQSANLQLRYSMQYNNAAVTSGDTILSFRSGENASSNVSSLLNLKMLDTASISGRYSDQLTFMCAVETAVELPIAWDCSDSPDGLVRATAPDGGLRGYKISEWHGPMSELIGLGYSLTIDGATNAWPLEQGVNLVALTEDIYTVYIGDLHAILLISTADNTQVTIEGRTVCLPEAGAYVTNYKYNGAPKIDAKFVVGITDFHTPVEIQDSWTQIAAAVDNGTYASKYHVGDYKPLTLSTGEVVYMQIVGMDVDKTTTGETAALSWLSMDCLNTTHSMNSTETKANGWAASGMRSWLQSTVYSTLPSNVKRNIVTVQKTYYDDTTKRTLTCNDTLWIPSVREVAGDAQNAQYDAEGWGTYESSGAIYGYCADAAVKQKSHQGTPEWWWLRTAFSLPSSDFQDISNQGFVMKGSNRATYPLSVVLGFCM